MLETRYYLVTGVAIEALRVLIAEGKANIAREQLAMLLNGQSFSENEITVTDKPKLIWSKPLEN